MKQPASADTDLSREPQVPRTGHVRELPLLSGSPRAQGRLAQMRDPAGNRKHLRASPVCLTCSGKWRGRLGFSQTKRRARGLEDLADQVSERNFRQTLLTHCQRPGLGQFRSYRLSTFTFPASSGALPGRCSRPSMPALSRDSISTSHPYQNIPSL